MPRGPLFFSSKHGPGHCEQVTHGTGDSGKGFLDQNKKKKTKQRGGSRCGRPGSPAASIGIARAMCEFNRGRPCCLPDSVLGPTTPCLDRCRQSLRTLDTWPSPTCGDCCRSHRQQREPRPPIRSVRRNRTAAAVSSQRPTTPTIEIFTLLPSLVFGMWQLPLTSDGEAFIRETRWSLHRRIFLGNDDIELDRAAHAALDLNSGDRLPRDCLQRSPFPRARAGRSQPTFSCPSRA